MSSPTQDPKTEKTHWFGRRRGRRVGAAPGTLVADPTAPKPVLHVIAYGPQGVVDQPITDLKTLPAILGQWPVTWLNVDGLGDVGVIRQLGEIFELHRLALEDVMNVHQRAKVEDYDEHEFIVVRMLNPGEQLDTEQFSMFLGRNFVLTFQEKTGDFFDSVRQRIRDGKGRIRTAGADYLTYALIDALIDSFFPVIERYGDRLDRLEESILGPCVHEQVVAEIHAIKRDLLTLRRSIWPQREALSVLLRGDSHHVAKETRIYLRDCYDHVVQIIDLLETYREISASLFEAYLSTVSNRMNDIMRVLTVISVIFMPLTFIAGVYGMNFHDGDGAMPLNMPELTWRYGYMFCLGLMALVACGMLVYFRRKRWI